jgi:hypothetical protein
MALVKAKVSTVIEDQIPDFIREDHTTFVLFLKSYYDYLGTIENRNLENIRDIDNTLDQFIDFFAKEILNPIPKNILADKKLLAKRVKDLYLSKGNINSYKLLFRLLYDIPAEIYVPKVDLLRVSDGKFSRDTIIRTTLISGNPNDLIGKTIRQGTTASALVENVLSTRHLDEEVYEIFINPFSIVGEFKLDEEVTTSSFVAIGTEDYGNIIDPVTQQFDFGILNTQDVQEQDYGVLFSDETNVILKLKNVVVKLNINNSGLYYNVGDRILFNSVEGSEALAEVASITTGSIKEIQVQSKGSGYSVGDEVFFDNTNSGSGVGSSLITARAIVTEVDADSILLESGEYLLDEEAEHINVEGFLTGGIKTVQILDSGQNYKQLPRVNAPPSQLFGEPAKLVAISDDIGKIRSVSILNQGYDYSGTPSAIFNINTIFKKISGEFSVGEKILSAEQSFALESNYDSELINEDGSRILFERQEYCEATIKSIDLTTNLYKLTNASVRTTLGLETSNGNLLDEQNNFLVKEESGSIRPNMSFIGQNNGAVGKLASGSSVGQAEGYADLGIFYTTPGNFVNADGKISDSSKRIQDSKFYQDYSYQIRTIESINQYRDIVRKLLHPLGLALFGALLHDGYGEASSRIPQILLDKIQVSSIKLIVDNLIDNSIKAMGNYRTNEEDYREIKKSEWTLIIFDWLGTQMTMIPQNPEFLPEIEVPRLTPEEVFLLDLRVDPMNGNEWLYILFNIKYDWNLHRETTLIMSPKIIEGSRGVGPCWDSLERFKFTLPPFEAGSKGTLSYTASARDQWIYGSYNYAYYDNPETTGNTQIIHYADIVIGEVINNPYKKINFAIDAYVDIIAPVSYDNTYITYDSTLITVDEDS